MELEILKFFMRGVPGAMGGGTFNIGESKKFAFFQTRKFSKTVKKSNEKVIIF